MKLLYKYRNGNYNVSLFEDGTKVRFTMDDEFNAEFPENIDMKITNYCDVGCAFCHENSTTKGNHSYLRVLPDFIDTLRPGTELALGGGKVTSHPFIKSFLKDLKKRNIISNITVSEQELLENKELIEELIEKKLIYGIGVSPYIFDKATIEFAMENPNVVLHLINGVHTEEQFSLLRNKGLKILILGYKYFRRGKNYLANNDKLIKENQDWLESNIVALFDEFKVVSFDNLAITQLVIQAKLSSEKWDEFYMGDDGQHTMYIDLVERKFAMNSTATERHDLLDNIDDMFSIVKENTYENDSKTRSI